MAAIDLSPRIAPHGLGDYREGCLTIYRRLMAVNYLVIELFVS